MCTGTGIGRDTRRRAKQQTCFLIYASCPWPIFCKDSASRRQCQEKNEVFFQLVLLRRRLSYQEIVSILITPKSKSNKYTLPLVSYTAIITLIGYSFIVNQVTASLCGRASTPTPLYIGYAPVKVGGAAIHAKEFHHQSAAYIGDVGAARGKQHRHLSRDEAKAG